MLAALCLFAAAATAGVFLAFSILGRRPVRLPIALVHGGAGALGLAALALVVISRHDAGLPGIALAILASNALLGFFLFSRHLLRRPWPPAAIVLHGLLALSGFGLLLYAYLGSP